MRKRHTDDKVSDLKEGNQVNDLTTCEQVNDEVTNDTYDNTVRFEETRIHIREEVRTTHMNGKLVVPMLDTCSSATVVNRSIITDSNEDEIRIESQGYKLSWRNTVNTDTDEEMCMDVHPPGKHLHLLRDEIAHCNNQNNKQTKEEPVIFPYKIGYGYCRTAGWLMNNNELNLPVNNEMYVGEEIEATESNENETIDDPRRGTKNLESVWTCSDNVLECSDNASTESQGSEVTKAE